MAFNKKKIYKQSLEIINDKNILDITELIAFLPCQRSTFYSFFPEESNELDNIKELIATNKRLACGSLKRKWIKSENPTLQIAAYKLMGEDDEVHRLNGSRQETTLKGDKENPIQIDDEAGRLRLIAELQSEFGLTKTEK